jgi:hypothetical protein
MHWGCIGTRPTLAPAWVRQVSVKPAAKPGQAAMAHTAGPGGRKIKLR